MTSLDDAAWREALEPAVAEGLARHRATAREWFPHEWVPWSRGRDFGGDSGVPWTPAQWPLDEAVRAALALNLLTEDNLPSYHHELLHNLSGDGAWGEWVRTWTAEEARHATSLRDFIHVTRAVDPAALERDRMASVAAGWTAAGKGLLRSLVYTSLQELATRIAHRNTGRAVGDAAAERLMSRIAADENLHMLFYRGVVSAALGIAPDQVIVAIAQEVKRFEMPGTGVPGFLRRSALIGEAGIYDVRMHRDEVVVPLLKHWNALGLAANTPEAAQAQVVLAAHLDGLREVADRFEERRARRAQPRARGGRLFR